MNKVNVLTVQDVEISKWRWWSDWIDVVVFNYIGASFILQMKISRTNKKKFNTIEMGGEHVHTTTQVVGDLVQMVGEGNE